MTRAAQPPSDPRRDRPADELDAFLQALRRPLDFLARAPAGAERRTHLPLEDLVARAEKLIEASPEPEVAGALSEIADALRRFGEAEAGGRRPAAALCLKLVDGFVTRRVGREDERPGGKGADAPIYQRSSGFDDESLAALREPVQFVKGVGPKRAAELGKHGIDTVEDLLYHLPFRYEDRRRIVPVARARDGLEAGFIGELVHLEERIVGRSSRRILQGVLRDESGLLGLTWYNRVSQFHKRYRRGRRFYVYGKVEVDRGGGFRIVHPEIEDAPENPSGAVVPVYGKPGSMTSKAMRKLVRQALGDSGPSLASALPTEIAERAGVCDLTRALEAVHRPPPDSDIHALSEFRSLAHRSLVFDELFYLQLGLALRRRRSTSERGFAMPGTGELTDRLIEGLPFALTGAQRAAIDHIADDMRRPHPMHRLVQGDVGSGKTVVGLYAALIAVENGRQAAFMAPTELLAEQHFATISRLAAPIGARVELLTSERLRGGRADAYRRLADGTTQIAVGTHALIQNDVDIPRLGLGIVDEQHRFGVLQRAALRRLGESDGVAPDILLMTATPIPRTLSLTVYGDLDVSLIDEMPPGRQEIETEILHQSACARAYDVVKRELDAGHQGYVVYPLVEASEHSDLRDATTMATELSRTVFGGYRVGLVHGKMKADEKEAVMRRFRAGELQLLVSTTVVEVGVDVPQATVMVIENAERFGLSQLHQLRGRVGRGTHKSYCMLVTATGAGRTPIERLEVLRQTRDGFRIAEADLSLRGPGEFLGTRQSGLPDFRVANMLRDGTLLVEARQAALHWLDRDPDLAGEESLALRAVLRHRWSGRLGLAEIG